MGLLLGSSFIVSQGSTNKAGVAGKEVNKKS